MAGKNENELDSSFVDNFEQSLNQIQPAPLKKSTGEILFESGRQLGLQQTLSISGNSSRQSRKIAAWQFATAAMFVFSLVSLSGWINQYSVNSNLIAASKNEIADDRNNDANVLARESPPPKPQQKTEASKTELFAVSTEYETHSRPRSMIANWLGYEPVVPPVSYRISKTGELNLIDKEPVKLVIAEPLTTRELLSELGASLSF